MSNEEYKPRDCRPSIEYRVVEKCSSKRTFLDQAEEDLVKFFKYLANQIPLRGCTVEFLNIGFRKSNGDFVEQKIERITKR